MTMPLRDAIFVALGVGATVASIILLPLWAALLAIGVAAAALAWIFHSRRPLRFGFAIVAFLLLTGAATTRLIGTQKPRSPSPIAYHRFKPSYKGPVWARITPAPEHVNDRHNVVLCWGPKIRPVKFRRLGPGPQSLLFEKTGTDDTRLRVRIRPPATITFGTGEPLDGNARDINDRWKRASCTAP